MKEFGIAIVIIFTLFCGIIFGIILEIQSSTINILRLKTNCLMDYSQELCIKALGGKEVYAEFEKLNNHS